MVTEKRTKTGQVWRGQWYRRKGSRTWRNRHTGEIRVHPRRRKAPLRGFEEQRKHFYGYDPKESKAKEKEVQKIIAKHQK